LFIRAGGFGLEPARGGRLLVRLSSTAIIIGMHKKTQTLTTCSPGHFAKQSQKSNSHLQIQSWETGANPQFHRPGKPQNRIPVRK